MITSGKGYTLGRKLCQIFCLPSEDDDAKFGFNHASTTRGGHLHQNGLVLR